MSALRDRQYTIVHTTTIDAPAETVWHHITAVDIASFDHPAYFSWLGIPKPLRAEITTPGVGGARTAYFANGRRFIQTITAWQPPRKYTFTFQADPGFRVGYLLDLASGPFQMTAGAYEISPQQDGIQLTLTSQYQLSGLAGIGLYLPVRLVLNLFQHYLLRGIKANAEREDGRA